MKTFCNSALIFALVLLVLGLAPQDSLAQTVSPSYLSFGVPTGTSGAVSVPQAVTVTITSGSVTFASPSASVSPSPSFAVTSNSCTGTLNAPAQCQVYVTLTTTSTTLLTGTLTISYSGGGTSTVPLSGAYGAIKLFDETTIAASNPTAGTSSPTIIGSAGLNLSCPRPPTSILAVLSNTPGSFMNPTASSLGYVLVDNYIIMSVNGKLVSNSNSPPGNVCTGGATDGSGVPDCFSNQYRTAVSTPPSIVGDLTDTVTNPTTTVPGMARQAGGVPPIDVSSYLSSDGSVQASFSLQDYGGIVASSSLFLVTNCTYTPDGVVPGGSVTGNPIVPDVPQTLAFDNNPGQNISVTTTNTSTDGAVPIVTDIGIPQALFSQLVVGSSAAPAVCLRMTGEVDSLGQTMCKGFLIQCYDPNNHTTTGDNCVPTASSARNLLDQAQFTSPDAPSGVNYLASACAQVVTTAGGTCAPGTGPGMLLGSDNWLCIPGSPNTSSCTPQELNTGETGTYDAGNCSLTGTLAGDLCPLDTLTQFRGAADPLSGSTTTGKNSIFIPVVNMPLPSTTTTIAGQTNGWLKTPSINATFVSNQATYSGVASNPAGNHFTAAPPYSLTYGLSPASAGLPDTTYPVPGDISNYNTGVNPNLRSPVCSESVSTSFTSTGTFGSLSDGIYNLHYFTTDCAFTEELVFNPTTAQLSDPTANWASFRYLTIGVDTTAPKFICHPPAPNSNGWYNTNLNVSCTVTDAYSAGVFGSGFGTPVNGIQGSPTETVTVSTNVAAGTVNSAASTNTLPVCDLAGNCVNVSAGPFQIDLQPADLAILALPFTDRIAHGSTGHYYAGVIDLSLPTSNGVVITSIFTVPNGVLSASPSASYEMVSCNLLWCSIPSSGTSCSPAVVNIGGSTTTATITCNVGQLASVRGGKGVVLMVNIPVLSTAPVNTTFTSVTTVSSANDPNAKDNSVSEKYTIK